MEHSQTGCVKKMVEPMKIDSNIIVVGNDIIEADSICLNTMMRYEN